MLTTWLRRFGLILLVLLMVLLLLYANHWINNKYFPPPPVPKLPLSITIAGQETTSDQPLVVAVQGETMQRKELAYVPKETDPKTDQPEKTDIQVIHPPEPVYIKVNDKEFTVPTEMQETAKFDKGKLVITEQSEFRLNLTTPKPALQVGIGWSSNGPAAQLNGPLYKNVAWWIYGDKRTFAGGIQMAINK